MPRSVVEVIPVRASGIPFENPAHPALIVAFLDHESSLGTKLEIPLRATVWKHERRRANARREARR